jgi:hypothetical protein
LTIQNALVLAEVIIQYQANRFIAVYAPLEELREHISLPDADEPFLDANERRNG